MFGDRNVSAKSYVHSLRARGRPPSRPQKAGRHVRVTEHGWLTPTSGALRAGAVEGGHVLTFVKLR